MDYVIENNLAFTPLVRRKSFDLIEKELSNIQLKGHQVVFLGISGGPACGITKISEYFHSRIIKSEIIRESSFFKLNSSDNLSNNIDKENEYLTKEYENYSKKRRLYLIDICSPNSFDYDKFYETLKVLREGKKIKIPYFDEEKCEYIQEKDKEIDPIKTPIIIIEGYYIFKDQRLKEMLNLKIFKEV